MYECTMVRKEVVGKDLCLPASLVGYQPLSHADAFLRVNRFRG